jgi:hypothetical protein
MYVSSRFFHTWRKVYGIFCTSDVTYSIDDSGVIARLSKWGALKPPETYEKFSPPRADIQTLLRILAVSYAMQEDCLAVSYAMQEDCFPFQILHGPTRFPVVRRFKMCVYVWSYSSTPHMP